MIENLCDFFKNFFNCKTSIEKDEFNRRLLSIYFNKNSPYHFNEEELSLLIDCFEIERKTFYENVGRWTCPICSIIQIADRYFGIDWEQGLTEYQEDLFYNQPEEVVPHTYEKTITFTGWESIEK